MNAPTVLPASLLARVGEPGLSRTNATFLPTALARGLLLIMPIPLAAAAGGALTRLPWPVPVTALVIGWSAALALSHLVPVSNAEPRRATRLILNGFAAVTTAWCVLLATVPASLVGDDRLLAYAVTVPGLGLLAVIAVGLATHTEARLLTWSLPGLLVATAWLAGWLPATVPVLGRLSPTPLLLATIGLLIARAGAAAAGRREEHGRLQAGDVARALRYLLLGLAQAVLVIGVWQVASTIVDSAVPAPSVILLVPTVPLIQVWVGWHLVRTRHGKARFDDWQHHQRHLRRLSWATLLPLLPLLAAGVVLAALAGRLPYGVSAHPDASTVMLSMAAGLLLPGVVALGLLLAARGLPGLAAVVTALPAAGGAVFHASAPGLAGGSLSQWGQPLPATVIALAAGYGIGLVLAAHVLADPRRRH